MTELLDFLVDERYQSYEDFLKTLTDKKLDRQLIKKAIQQLELISGDELNGVAKCSCSCGITPSDEADKKAKNIIKTIKAMTAEAGEIHFLFNICWFYRWLLSEGYHYVYEDSCIEMIRKFIKDITIPGYVSRKIKWTFVFGNYATFNKNDEKAVYEDILDQLSPSKSMKTFSDIIDCWLILHIILRENEEIRTPTKKSTIDLYMEKILLNYISLVDNYPELEAVFGVAIEKDMELVYNSFKKKG